MIQKALNSGAMSRARPRGLCRLTSGRRLHDSDLIILAGRPGMGKSSLATNIASICADRLLRDQRDGVEGSVGAARGAVQHWK
jgi:replicative DNA helicase